MKRDALLLPTLLALLSSSIHAQEPSNTSGDPAQLAQQLMQTEVAFENMVPTGTSIEVKETSRHGTSSKDLVVTYRIYIKGSSPDTLFDWVQWPVNQQQPSTALSGISVGKDGLLICAGRKPTQCGDPAKPDDPIDFTSTPRKGEPVRFAFLSQALKIGTVIIPDPIAASDRGCTLSAVRLTPKFELAFLSGTGYPPNTDIHYQFISERTSDRTIKSNENGVIRVSQIPFAGNKSKGIATFKVISPQCSPEVSYEWGTI